MKLRVLALEPEQTEMDKVYFTIAVRTDPDDPRTIRMRPGLLQYQEAPNPEWKDVEMKYGLELEQTGDVRAVSAEVQVPVYRAGGDEGREAGGEGARDIDPQDR